MDGQIVEVDRDRREALRVDQNEVRAVEPDLSVRLHIDRGSQNAAVLMVGMVAADLGAAGRGKVIELFHRNTSIRPVRQARAGKA